MNKKRLFFDFLQKHYALKAYKQAFEVTRLKRNNKKTNEYVPLICSFIWADTPEGHVYWHTLNKEWSHYYNSIKMKYHF